MGQLYVTCALSRSKHTQHTVTAYRSNSRDLTVCYAADIVEPVQLEILIVQTGTSTAAQSTL